MRRRDFIAGIGGAAIVWPLAADAQQRERMRRIGVLIDLAADDPEASIVSAGLLQGLQELGWTVGRNAQIDFRWGANDEALSRKHAAELVALAPDVIYVKGGPSLRGVLTATRTLPIVFTNVIDPVGAGRV